MKRKTQRNSAPSHRLGLITVDKKLLLYYSIPARLLFVPIFSCLVCLRSRQNDFDGVDRRKKNLCVCVCNTFICLVPDSHVRYVDKSFDKRAFHTTADDVNDGEYQTNFKVKYANKNLFSLFVVVVVDSNYSNFIFQLPQ